MTRGKYRVGIDFNPSNDDTVGRIKKAAADFIDLIDEVNSALPNVPHSGEVQRLKALAQTRVEEAAMWAVKAATKKAPE